MWTCSMVGQHRARREAHQRRHQSGGPVEQQRLGLATGKPGLLPLHAVGTDQMRMRVRARRSLCDRNVHGDTPFDFSDELALPGGHPSAEPAFELPARSSPWRPAARHASKRQHPTSRQAFELRGSVEKSVERFEHTCAFPKAPIADDVNGFLRPCRCDVQQIGTSTRPTTCTPLLRVRRSQNEEDGFRLPTLNGMNRSHTFANPLVRVVDPAIQHAAGPSISRMRSCTTTNGVTT